MLYKFEVAGVSYKNKDGEARRDIVIDNLYPDYSSHKVFLRRHSGNRSDKNAIGVYIEKSAEPMMIGFVPRDLARDVSPMMRLGHAVDDIKITRVWVPSYSDKATPVVTVSFEGKWSQLDIRNYKNRLSEDRRLAREIRKTPKETQQFEIKRKKSITCFLSHLLSPIYHLFKKK